jgi:hypothetical protein
MHNCRVGTTVVAIQQACVPACLWQLSELQHGPCSMWS